MSSPPASNRRRNSKRSSDKDIRTSANIFSFDHDILSTVFGFLDLFDLVRCSAVCKTWKTLIHQSNILQVLYCKQCGSAGDSNASSFSGKSIEKCIGALAMEHHKSCLQKGHVDVYQWKGHSVGVDQCRMKMGMALTGIGDKVMRLWSVKNYKCLEEYSLSNMAPLIDFDFDESKIVGLVGTRLSIWRRNGKRSIFPSSEGTFTKGLCMRYTDPEAVVGCEDGTVRIFDMYSRKCSQIIRMRTGPITCLSLGEDQLILGGSTHGKIAISCLSSDQLISTLHSSDRAGISTLFLNQSSHLAFSGSTSGYVSCWELRKFRTLWQTRVSPNVIYSIQSLQNDCSTLVTGGIDGVLRILDQNSGSVLSNCIIGDELLPSSCRGTYGVVERRKGKRLSRDVVISSLPRTTRSPITCLAVGMNKVITTHNSKYIRTWEFHK